MKVWIVTTHDYRNTDCLGSSGETEVVGIYSSEEKADNIADVLEDTLPNEVAVDVSGPLTLDGLPISSID